jgi:hypothetical protein
MRAANLAARRVTSRQAAVDHHSPDAGRAPIAIARVGFIISVLAAASAMAPGHASAQPVTGAQAPAANRAVIASLANATDPSDLDYQGGECDIDADGSAMDCGFQQVFLTISPVDPQTCLVTTNQYARRFHKQGATRWVSSEGPHGECGLLDVATLEDEGNMIHWSLEMKTVVTRKDLASCSGAAAPPQLLSWRNARRPLPCRFVAPGAIRP